MTQAESKRRTTYKDGYFNLIQLVTYLKLKSLVQAQNNLWRDDYFNLIHLVTYLKLNPLQSTSFLSSYPH